MEQGDDELQMNEELDLEDFELNMMKDRFAKLLLGEDMSGSGKGVCTAVTISNAITNLYGQLLSLGRTSKQGEEGNVEKRNGLFPLRIRLHGRVCLCLLSGTFTRWHHYRVLMHKPRSDIYLNLPALQKLDAMLISARASIGDSIYKQMYYPENLLDSLNIKSEHETLELADRVEEAMYTWKRKACVDHSKSSWDLMKDLVDTDRNDKNQTLAHRAESLLFCLKPRAVPDKLGHLQDSIQLHEGLALVNQ